MSARSPRSSLSGASSAEIAEDFADSLKDLQANNRTDIGNLTVIAKENTEHAQAISKSIENHIKTVRRQDHVTLQPHIWQSDHHRQTTNILVDCTATEAPGSVLAR